MRHLVAIVLYFFANASIAIMALIATGVDIYLSIQYWPNIFVILFVLPPVVYTVAYLIAMAVGVPLIWAATKLSPAIDARVG